MGPDAVRIFVIIGHTRDGGVETKLDGLFGRNSNRQMHFAADREMAVTNEKQSIVARVVAHRESSNGLIELHGQPKTTALILTTVHARMRGDYAGSGSPPQHEAYAPARPPERPENSQRPRRFRDSVA